DVLAKLARRDELDHALGRVRSVATNATADHAVEPRAGAHRADQEHASPVSALERAVVEPDDVHGVLAQRVTRLEKSVKPMRSQKARSSGRAPTYSSSSSDSVIGASVRNVASRL